MHPNRFHHAGFSLVEMLVTIAILAIIASIAAPALGTFVSRSAMRGISGDFTLAMQRARSEAINRNECVTVCTSSNSTSCDSSGDQWGVGWIGFRSPTCAAATPDAADIFLVREGFSTRYELKSSDSTPVRSVLFNTRGNTTSSSGASFKLQDSQNPSSDINRTFCLDFAGRIRTLEYAASCS